MTFLAISCIYDGKEAEKKEIGNIRWWFHIRAVDSDKQEKKIDRMVQMTREKVFHVF